LGGASPDYGTTPKPELLNADTNPTLRYPVCVMETPSSVSPNVQYRFAAPARSSPVSCGWLDLTRNALNYTVVQSGSSGKPAQSPGAKFVSSEASDQASAAADEDNAGFEASLSDAGQAVFAKGLLMFYISQTKVLLTYSPQGQWGMMQSQRALTEYAQQNAVGTAAILEAIKNFDSVLAEVKPPAPPALVVSLRADPASVEKGHSVTLVWNSANATSLDLEPSIGRVAPAGQISVTPQDSTTYILSAAGAAGPKVATAYVSVTAPAPAAVPTVVVTEPSVADGQTVEVSSTSFVIRGVVMDASGIPVITINGRSVMMRPTSAQAAQFTSDPIELQPGENRFEVSAVNSAHGQAKVNFIARLTAAPPKPQPAAPTTNPKGMGRVEIISLLQGDVPSARVADLVRQRGIKFVPTPDDLKEIRAAGGGDDLIDAIDQAAAPPRN
jgi:hypothetical protein